MSHNVTLAEFGCARASPVEGSVMRLMKFHDVRAASRYSCLSCGVTTACCATVACAAPLLRVGGCCALEHAELPRTPPSRTSEATNILLRCIGFRVSGNRSTASNFQMAELDL